MKNKSMRQSLIREEIMNHGNVSVEALSKQFSVSAVTIRKDLRELESSGTIRKTYGGAKLTHSLPRASMPRNFISSEVLRFSDDMNHIASVASQLISSNEWIFLGNGDTCAAIAKALDGQPCQIVTNSLVAASVLSLNNQANVLVTGGMLSGYERNYMSGEALEESVREIHFNKAFFGASGFDIEAGFTCTSMNESDVFEYIRKRAETIFFAVSSRKLGVVSFKKIADIKDADYIITDTALPSGFTGQLSADGKTKILF